MTTITVKKGVMCVLSAPTCSVLVRIAAAVRAATLLRTPYTILQRCSSKAHTASFLNRRFSGAAPQETYVNGDTGSLTLAEPVCRVGRCCCCNQVLPSCSLPPVSTALACGICLNQTAHSECLQDTGALGWTFL
eukprot:GHUV01044551.1.p1 GENE.GHUV01044551.1~~GHUV01044551.1.p1  ORF type:complete len:134 (+),score=15.06 GHUV01044551.1:92-493(+)